MVIGDPPHGDRERLAGDNVVPLIGSVSKKVEFFDLLSPLLEEGAARSSAEGSTLEGTVRISALLEENARLRTLAAELSNLLGDLPAQEWSAALRRDK